MFCLKLPYSSRKSIKKVLHFKMLTFQNAKFDISEYSNTAYVTFKKDNWWKYDSNVFLCVTDSLTKLKIITLRSSSFQSNLFYELGHKLLRKVPKKSLLDNYAWRKTDAWTFSWTLCGHLFKLFQWSAKIHFELSLFFLFESCCCLFFHISSTS